MKRRRRRRRVVTLRPVAHPLPANILPILLPSSSFLSPFLSSFFPTAF